MIESEFRDEMWKHAYLVSAFLVGERNHVDSFLTDEQENVLCHFGMEYQDNSKYLDMKANDVNRDGRMDLEIVYQVEQPSYTTTKCVTHTFFQMEDGFFIGEDKRSGHGAADFRIYLWRKVWS